MNQAQLFAMPEPHAPAGPNEAAVDALCEELEGQGLLTGKWRALSVSLRSTAKAVDTGIQQSKISVATSKLMALLQEGLQAMPEPRAKTSDAYDTLASVIDLMTREAITGEKQGENAE